MLFPKIITAIIFFAGLTLLGTVVWQVGMKSVLESLGANRICSMSLGRCSAFSAPKPLYADGQSS